MMYCQVCKKNIATVHYTEIDVNYKVKKETHMCEACAQAHGLQGAVPKTVSAFQVIEKLIKPSLPEQRKARPEMRCGRGGMNSTEFRSAGRLGCPHDYKVFREGIENVLEQVQGGARNHVGKIPRRAGVRIRLQARQASLQKALKDAIAAENYERAAEIRDGLKAIEEEIKEKGFTDDGV